MSELLESQKNNINEFHKIREEKQNERRFRQNHNQETSSIHAY